MPHAIEVEVHTVTLPREEPQSIADLEPDAWSIAPNLESRVTADFPTANDASPDGFLPVDMADNCEDCIYAIGSQFWT